MSSYSTNALVQQTVYGVSNSDLDTECERARDIATSFINATLGYQSDLSTVPDLITRCASLLAGGIISSTPDKIEESVYWKLGIKLLERLGEEVTTGSTYNTIPVTGFGRYESEDEDSAYNR